MTAVGAVELAVAGAVIAVARVGIPEWDIRVPVIQHHGLTHTVWVTLFAVGVLVATSTRRSAANCIRSPHRSA